MEAGERDMRVREGGGGLHHHDHHHLTVEPVTAEDDHQHPDQHPMTEIIIGESHHDPGQDHLQEVHHLEAMPGDQVLHHHELILQEIIREEKQVLHDQETILHQQGTMVEFHPQLPEDTTMLQLQDMMRDMRGEASTRGTGAGLLLLLLSTPGNELYCVTTTVQCSSMKVVLKLY